MVSSIGQDIAFTQLSSKTKKSVLGQLLFLSVALIVPTITHNLRLNYLVSQPMHWMVIFAGLTYGMVSGTVLGLLIPLASFLLSGMPVVAALPLMIPELMVYGLISGMLKKKITSFGSIITALIVGKIVYLGIAMALGRINVPAITFIQKTWGSGIITMIIQIISIPVFSGLYINWIKQD